MEEDKNGLFNNLSKAADDVLIGPVRQRISHPFVGSFFVSWLLINWKPILYLVFDGDGIKNKIVYISSNFYISDCKDFFYYLIFPFSIAFIYNVGLKYFDNLMDYLNVSPKKKSVSFRTGERIHRINEEIKVVRKQHELNNERANNKSIEELNSKIETLTLELANRDKIVEGMENEKISILKKLNDLQNEINSNIELNSTSQSEIRYLSKNLNSLKESILKMLKVFRSVLNYDVFVLLLSDLKKYYNDLEDFADLFKIIEQIENEISSTIYYPFENGVSEEILTEITEEFRNIDPAIKVSVEDYIGDTKEIFARYLHVELQIDLQNRLQEYSKKVNKDKD